MHLALLSGHAVLGMVARVGWGQCVPPARQTLVLHALLKTRRGD